MQRRAGTPAATHGLLQPGDGTAVASLPGVLAFVLMAVLMPPPQADSLPAAAELSRRLEAAVAAAPESSQDEPAISLSKAAASAWMYLDAVARMPRADRAARLAPVLVEARRVQHLLAGRISTPALVDAWNRVVSGLEDIAAALAGPGGTGARAGRRPASD
jgi:hypothetical protein